MKFIIKGLRPHFYETLDWSAAEESNSKICFLNIEGKLFELNKESFEMLRDFYEKKVLDPLWTIVVDNGHIMIWGM